MRLQEQIDFPLDPDRFLHFRRAYDDQKAGGRKGFLNFRRQVIAAGQLRGIPEELSEFFDTGLLLNVFGDPVMLQMPLGKYSGLCILRRMAVGYEGFIFIFGIGGSRSCCIQVLLLLIRKSHIEVHESFIIIMHRVFWFIWRSEGQKPVRTLQQHFSMKL